MMTNLSGADDAKAEMDERWAQWVAHGARSNRERQKAVARFAIVIAIALAIWITMLLVRG